MRLTPNQNPMENNFMKTTGKFDKSDSNATDALSKTQT